MENDELESPCPHCLMIDAVAAEYPDGINADTMLSALAMLTAEVIADAGNRQGLLFIDFTIQLQRQLRAAGQNKQGAQVH